MFKSNDSLRDLKITNFRSSPDIPGQISLFSRLAILVHFRAGFRAENRIIFGMMLNVLDFENVCFDMSLTGILEHQSSRATTPWGTRRW